MPEFKSRLSRFSRRLILRQVVIALFFGWLVAAVILVAAPWLRDWMGQPAFEISLALPLALPLLWGLFAFLTRPNEKTTVMVADSWNAARGDIVSAWEMTRDNPDSPFAEPILNKAQRKLDDQRMIWPSRWKYFLWAGLIVLLLLPTSRWVHAAMNDDDQRQQEEDRPDVNPQDAEQIAKDAGQAATEAEKNQAKAQQELAEDIEEAARRTQAGADDTQRALREAQALEDRAKSQVEAQERREAARESLAENETTKDLAEALERSDPKAIEREAEKLADDVLNKDGTVDKQTASELRQAVEDAARKAPTDDKLRRSAEELAKSLDPKRMERLQSQKKAEAQRRREAGQSEEQIKAALEAMEKMDRETMKRAIEEFAKNADQLRDLDPNGETADKVRQMIENGEISPEQAKKLAESAKEMSKRLELDAKELKEMVRKGKDYEGLDKAAKRAIEKARAEGKDPKHSEIPSWGNGELPKPETRGGTAAGGRESGEKENTEEGSGPGRGKGADGEHPNGSKVAGEGKKLGVDVNDAGGGEKDPDSKIEKLDPNKAKDEKAGVGVSGRDGKSKGVNTRIDEENLPRRFRNVAKKYFDRD